MPKALVGMTKAFFWMITQIICVDFLIFLGYEKFKKVVLIDVAIIRSKGMLKKIEILNFKQISISIEITISKKFPITFSDIEIRIERINPTTAALI